MLFRMIFILFSMYQLSDASKSDEEVKMELTKLILGCTKDVAVDPSELMNLQLLKTPTNHATKCLLACAYKKEGSMNDKGMIDESHTIKRAVEIAGDDAERLERAKELNEICLKVNDEKVSDGEKGCDRAALIFACLVKNAPKLGFKI